MNKNKLQSALLGNQNFINRHGGARTLAVRLCENSQLEPILQLQDLVHAQMAEKDAFVCTKREELLESLEQDLCVGIFDEDRLAAFSLLVVNRDSPRNLGSRLEGGPERFRLCAAYDTTFIHPDYRGYGMQRFFIGLKNELCVQLGVREVFATVSPDNASSLRNLLGSGFEIVRESTLYGGYRRYILRHTLEGGGK